MRGLLPVALFVFTVVVCGVGVACGFAGALKPIGITLFVAGAEFMIGFVATVISVTQLNPRQGHVDGLSYIGVCLSLVVGVVGAALTVAGQFSSALAGGGH